jgi:hypothetical protein
MAAGSTYTPIATTTLGSATSSYTFSSIPSTYTDLVMASQVQLDTAGGYSMGMRFNSDSGSNYSYTYILGTGSVAASSRGTSQTSATYGNGATGWGTSIVNIMNYSNTTTYKTCVARNGQAGDVVQAYVNLWRNTAAINSINIISQSGSNFVAGTTFTLYGIAAA